MEAFKNAVTIRRTPAEVFTFLADFENVPRWNYAIESTTKVSPGPVEMRTVYNQIRSIPGRAEEGYEVTVFEPGRRLAIEGTVGPLCDRVREVCPEFPRHPDRIHWSIADPALEGETDEESYPAFQRTAVEIETRVRFLLPVIDGRPVRR